MDMATANGNRYPRMCGDSQPLPNGRVLLISGQMVSVAVCGVVDDDVIMIVMSRKFYQGRTRRPTARRKWQGVARYV